MVFVPFANTCRVELRMTQDSQQVENVFHVEKEGILTVTDLENIGSIFVDWWDGHRNLVGSTVTLRELDIRDLTTASGLGILYNAGLPLVGLLATAVMPNSVTVAIKWGTGLTGRSFRGRSYHVGLVEGQVLNNALETATVAGLLASYNSLIANISGGGYTLVVASRVANGVPRVSGVTTPILVASYADTTIDSQRRRLPGRGR